MSPGSERKFIEVGQYFPLINDNPDAPTLSLGDKNRQGVFSLDTDCKNEPCFKGQINLQFKQVGGQKNELLWSVSDDINGEVSLMVVPDDWSRRLHDFFLGAKEYRDGTQGVQLPYSISKLILKWESKENSRHFLKIPLTIELTPESQVADNSEQSFDRAPRMVVQYPSAKIYTLPAVQQNETSSATPLVYITSSEVAVALQNSNAQSYVPVLQVGQSIVVGKVNAFLERTESNGKANSGFIINNGLYRNSYSFGTLSYIGAESGVVATVLSSSGRQSNSIVFVCFALWAIPFYFYVRYLFFSPGSNLILRTDSLAVLLAITQMLLAVQFILGLRAYWWSPFNREAFENVVFALIFVPVMIFTGCFAFGLRRLGYYFRRSGLKGMIAELYRFPPLWLWISSLVLFPMIFYFLQSRQPFSWATTALAFHSWETFQQPFFILFGTPLALLIVGLILDWNLNQKSSGYAGNGFYKSYLDCIDPITYALSHLDESITILQEQKWNQYALAGLLSSIGFVITWLPGIMHGATRWYMPLYAFFAFVGSILFFISAKILAKQNVFFSVFAKSLFWVAIFIAAVFILRLFFPPIGDYGNIRFESLCRIINIRASFVFEIISLVLVMNLLRVFSVKWRNLDEGFGLKGLIEFIFLFAAPPVLIFLGLSASHDMGAMLVHPVAQIGLLFLATGTWALWKLAARKKLAFGAVLIPVLIIIFYITIVYTQALSFAANFQSGNNSSFQHRVVLLQGTTGAMNQAETGGKKLLDAIEQQWYMMNYAAWGDWWGQGYGKAPVADNRVFAAITLSDLVFSIYVLSEHGAMGGLMLIGLYLLIFTAIISVGWNIFWKSAPHDNGKEMRFAFLGGLGLMLVFPAIYMMGANVNQIIFTGQNIPLLSLRSNSELLRTGFILMLLFAIIQPLVPQEDEYAEVSEKPSMQKLLAELWQFITSKVPRVSPTTGAQVLFLNTALIALTLILVILIIPVWGIFKVANNEEYQKDLSFTRLKSTAAEYIKNKLIWFEALEPGQSATAPCRAGDKMNKLAAPDDNLFDSYRLCMDVNVRGGGENETLATLIKYWNTRSQRGNGIEAEEKFDVKNFFRLDIPSISTQSEENRKVLTVNQSSYNKTSPFRQSQGWSGALVEDRVETTNGGVLVGSNIILPLTAVPFDGTGPVLVGASKDRVPVNLEQPQRYRSSRGFAVFEGGRYLFDIETVKGAVGALLRPIKGDFQLYLNGESLYLSQPSDNVPESQIRTTQAVRIDDGDVIAYAVKDGSGKLVAKHVFIYNQARIGTFSYRVWLNGEERRFYPQGESWAMAKQITDAINDFTKIQTSKSNNSESQPTSENNDWAISINSDLNRSVYEFLQRWKTCLDGTPERKSCRIEGVDVNAAQLEAGKSRRMAITLMNTNTGSLLALASNDGKTYNPSDSEAMSRHENLNLTRHVVGSAIKPFTASATLRTFPDLYQMTLIDRRNDKGKLFGMNFDSKELVGRNNRTTVAWNDFLPPSDNLYAVTLALLGMSKPEGTVPRFQSSTSLQSNRFQLELNDNGTNLGMPEWVQPDMINPRAEAGQRQLALLNTTPLAENLENLFSVRSVEEPQTRSYSNDIWLPVFKDPEFLKKQNPFDRVSPEMTNFAFTDITRFSELRQVLLGGGFGDSSMLPYGSIGGQWSNVFLAQSFARIVTGKKIKAQIIKPVGTSPDTPLNQPEPWFDGARDVAWREALLSGLEGVAKSENGTAHNVFSGVLNEIGGSNSLYAVRSRNRAVTIFCKSGTLANEQDTGESDQKFSDSIFIFTVGVWNDSTKEIENSVTGTVYIERGGTGQASRLSAALVRLLNRYYNWNTSGRQQ